MTDYMPDLSALEYEPQNFRDLAHTELGNAVWAFLKRHDNLIRMEPLRFSTAPPSSRLLPVWLPSSVPRCGTIAQSK